MHRAYWLLALAIALASGCQRPQTNLMTIVSYRAADRPETFYQRFSQAWFRQVNRGEFEILMASDEPISAPGGGQVLRQELYAKVFWQPVPGKTFAESTQINTRFQYRLETVADQGSQVVAGRPASSVYYRGAGFISLELDRTGAVLSGSIEQATFEPRDRSQPGSLGKFILHGPFSARRNNERIVDYLVTRPGPP